MKYILTHPESIENNWKAIEPFIQRVVDEGFGEVSVFNIFSRLMNGKELLLCALTEDDVLQSICILAVVEFETGKRALEMPYIAGSDLYSWVKDGFETIKEIARLMNCTHIRGAGRKGWNKVLPELKVIRTVYEYTL